MLIIVLVFWNDLKFFFGALATWVGRTQGHFENALKIYSLVLDNCLEGGSSDYTLSASLFDPKKVKYSIQSRDFRGIKT